MPLKQEEIAELRGFITDILKSKKLSDQIVTKIAGINEDKKKPSKESIKNLQSILEEKISAEKQEIALDVIAYLMAERSLPVILTILDEIIKKTGSDDSSTTEFLQDAIKKLTDADVKQNMNPIKLGWKMRDIKAKDICRDLDALVAGAEKIQVKGDTEELWEALALWLEGLYKRSYYTAYKNPKTGLIDEKEHRHDWEDVLFMKWTKNKEDGFPDGLNKLSVSTRYRDSARKITERIKAYRNPQLMEVSLNSKPVQKKPEEKEQNPFEKEVQGKYFSKFKFTRVSCDVPDLDPRKVDQIIQAIKGIMGSEYYAENGVPKNNALEEQEAFLSEEELHNGLNPFKDEPELTRFQILIAAVRGAKLPEKQNNLLKDFKGMIIALFENYLNSSFSTYGIPTKLRTRPHEELVNEKLKEVKAADDLVQHLNILFSLWQELTRKSSNTMKKNVAALLSFAFTVLHKGTQPIAQSAPQSIQQQPQSAGTSASLTR